MSKKTSFHNFNADKKTNGFDKIIWYCSNVLNNISFGNKGLEIKRIKYNNLDGCPEIKSAYTPSRTLSDLFWKNLNWVLIQKELGEINIFDTGCGAGDYADKLMDYSNDRINLYHGVDLSPRDCWKSVMAENPKIKLKELSSIDILPAIPENTNFFISQSAIEHFEYDLVFFDQLKTFIEKSGKPTIQIHLFPSAACLSLYLFHGIRQYTPRTIVKIVDKFKMDSYFKLFELGGANCNRLHWDQITKTEMIKKKQGLRKYAPEEYSELLKNAIIEDSKIESGKPSFYALVIHSNFNNRIWT